jgi:hypothetical protein
LVVQCQLDRRQEQWCGGVALALVVGLGASPAAKADEAFAKTRMKAMSDYMAKQTAISFGYDSDLEIVTKDHQKLMLANSGTVDVVRPEGSRRAALVVSPSAFTESTGFAIVCPITSRVRPFPTSVVLPAGLPVAGEILTRHIRSVDT